LSTAPPVPENAHRRAALAAEVAARTGLDPAAIARFLRVFYAAARGDALLGPAFAEVTDWEGHIASLTRFWCSVALFSGDYHGQPLQAHRPLALTQAHFARWLVLFEQVARVELTAEGADLLLDRAHRIARSLEMGLVPLQLPAARRRMAQGSAA
jgi:hemoglobin